MSSRVLPWPIAVALASLALLAPARALQTAPADEASLVNGDFETEGTAGDLVPGWTVEELRQDVGTLPEVELEITSKTRRTGRRSLRQGGDVVTSTWFVVSQELAARPGARYSLSAWSKTLGVQVERLQEPVCHVALVLLDATGAEEARALIEPDRPRQRWSEGAVSLQASPAARRVRVEIALGMSGEFWVDDVALAVDGGWPLPEPEVVFRDRFDDAGAAWTPEVVGEGRSGEVRPERRGDDGWVMGFTAQEGDGATATMARRIDVSPGDVLYPSASARGAAPDGGFADLRLALTFFDGRGQPLGDDSEDWFEGSDRTWSELGLVAVAPDGAAEARLSLGLFGPGDAQVEEVALVREPGAVPPFTGWERSEGDHVVVLMAPGHPDERRLALLVHDLDQAVVDSLGAGAADDAGTLVVHVHRDAASVRATTGEAPPVIDRRGRSVHVTRTVDAVAALVELLGG